MKLILEYANTDFWREKTNEYATEDLLKPTIKTKLKIVGSALACLGTCIGEGLVPGALLGIYRQDKLGGIIGEEARIRHNLLKRGYAEEDLSRLIPHTPLHDLYVKED